ncbi:hypothetical protein [Mucilaginibacter sp.]|uniref:hypothetical protein n=1 Tax=Mucilaginibacter sp. TaxID=1882438 RepID=UPI003AFF7EC7
MKKTYLSLRHIFAIMLLLTTFVISCRKETVQKPVNTEQNATKSLSVANAKAYLDSALKTDATTIKLSSTDGGSSLATFNGFLFWGKAKAFLNSRFEVVEVPVALDYRITNFYKLGGDTSAYDMDTAVAKAAFTRALIYRDSSKKIIDKRIITYIPDKSYLAKNPDPSNNNWLNGMDKKFSGYIEYRNWDNEVNMVIRISGGKPRHLYNVTVQSNAPGILKPQGLKTNSTMSCVIFRVPDLVIVCSNSGSWCSEPRFNGTYSYFQVCQNMDDDDEQFGKNRPPIPPNAERVSDNGSGGGGSSSSSSPTVSNGDIANSIYVDNGKLPIDPKKRVNCFTDGKPASQYKMTIYVDQPLQGSNEPISITKYSGETYKTPNGTLYNVGHTFVGFTKINTDRTSVTQVMGFYPGGGVSIRPDGVVKDDGGHGYSISYTSTVSAVEFNAALQLVVDNESLAHYQLSTVGGINEYNCTDAAIHWMWEANVNVPSGTPNGSLNTSPGQYGQDLRSVSGTNTTPGYAPNSHGDCN